MTKVLNSFPSLEPTSYRLAIVGEAPGADEEAAGKPFIGMSGKFLDNLLASAGISRMSCFVGNVCQVRPPGNDISKFELDGPEIQEGLKQLESDLAKFRPHCVLLLGKTALWAASGLRNLSDWRGSVFESDRLGPKLKCLATYHPAAALRSYDFTPLLRFDIARAAKESHFPELRLPERNLIVNPTFDELVALLNDILLRKPPIACDIEGGVHTLSCMSIAESPKQCFIVPFELLDGSSFWTHEQEVQIWWLVARILADPLIRKIWQNQLYDKFVLQHAYNIIVLGDSDDTMIKHWELYAELEKALSVQASIYTDEPFWKWERKASAAKANQMRS